MQTKPYLAKLQLYAFSKWELLEKKEFKEIEGLFLINEHVIDMLVGEIDQLAHLVVLTNMRLFTISKFIEINAVINQYGLEEVADVKLQDLGQIADLVFFIKNKKLIKLSFLKLSEAQKFGKELTVAYHQWMQAL